jgi:hypothetical protein
LATTLTVAVVAALTVATGTALTVATCGVDTGTVKGTGIASSVEIIAAVVAQSVFATDCVFFMVLIVLVLALGFLADSSGSV